MGDDAHIASLSPLALENCSTMAIRSALVLALALLPAADAFAPAGQRAVVRTVRFETEGETEVEAAAEAPAPAPATAVPKTDSRGWTTVNGWTPDSKVRVGRDHCSIRIVVHLF
jgi:predicted cobalt transporter CbtA